MLNSLNISSKGEPGGNSNGNGLIVVITVCVVDILTTDGISFSAKSAKDSGVFFALAMNDKLIINKEIAGCLNEESHKLQARKTKNSKSIKKLERQKIKIGKEKERLNRKQVKLVERHDKLKRKFELDTKTKEYNLNTSLKNYIDPRIYKKWSEKVEVDWNKIYPKSMQKKFIWVEKENT